MQPQVNIPILFGALYLERQIAAGAHLTATTKIATAMLDTATDSVGARLDAAAEGATPAIAAAAATTISTAATTFSTALVGRARLAVPICICIEGIQAMRIAQNIGVGSVGGTYNSGRCSKVPESQ